MFVKAELGVDPDPEISSARATCDHGALDSHLKVTAEAFLSGEDYHLRF